MWRFLHRTVRCVHIYQIFDKSNWRLSLLSNSLAKNVKRKYTNWCNIVMVIIAGGTLHCKLMAELTSLRYFLVWKKTPTKTPLPLSGETFKMPREINFRTKHYLPATLLAGSNELIITFEWTTRYLSRQIGHGLPVDIHPPLWNNPGLKRLQWTLDKLYH